MSRILYLMTPAGDSTSTTASFFLPISAMPNGDSLEMKPFKLFASVEPTMENSISSSNSISRILTRQPTLITSPATSSSSMISAFFKIFSSSTILASISACSSFAASYSSFSDKSPCSLASLIFSATSWRLTTFKSCNSSSSFFKPA